MPPKKKKSSKKSGKKGKKSAKEINPDEIQIDEPELNKEFFQFHIRDLERKMKLYEEKTANLQEENKEYMKTQKEKSAEKYQTVDKLKKQLLRRGDELSDMKDRYSGLQQAKETEKARYEAQLQTIQSSMQETKDMLTAENNVLSAKLSALEEFKQQKEAHLKRYAERERALAEKKVEHEEELEKIKDKNSQDRDRLKKDIVSRINLVAAEFRKVSQKQTSDTTKRTIRENVSIRSQLTKMEDKNVELLQDNEQMQRRVWSNKHRLRELDQSHTELASKTSSHVKLLHLLVFKFQEYQENVDQCLLEDAILQQINQENQAIISDLEEAKELIKIETEQQKQLQEVLDGVRSASHAITDDIDRARGALAEAIQQLRSLLQARFPRRCHKQQRKESSSTANGDSELDSEEWGTLEQRIFAEERLQRLLDALEYDGSSETASFAESVPNSHAPLDRPSAESPSISITSRRLTSAGLLRQSGRSGATMTTKATEFPSVISEFEIRRQAKLMLLQEKKGFCVPGLLQMVPPMSRHIANNREKARGINRRLMGLDSYGSESKIERPIKSQLLTPQTEAKLQMLTSVGKLS